MKKTIIILSALAMLLSACVSLGRLDKNATLSSGQKSVFVLGVAPENFRLSIFPGSIDDGRFRQSPWRPAAIYGAAKNGYLVGEASAGETLAITLVQVVKDKDSIFGQHFVPCRNGKTMAFRIPRGRVIYLGDVQYEVAGGHLGMKYSQDIDAARKYIREYYPRLRGRLEPWKYRLLPTNAACQMSIYIPTYTAR